MRTHSSFGHQKSFTLFCFLLINSLTPNILVSQNIGFFQGFLSPGQNSAKFSKGLSTAGDVNLDGFDDIAVGAYYYDNGQTNEGRLYLYHGSTTGVNTTAVWTFECDQASAQLGFDVEGGKDINNDGYPDLIASANLFDNGQTDEGKVYMFLGSAAGFPIVPSWTFESNNATATLGNSIDFAGDVNNDGYEDVIVGAMNYDMAVNEGKVFVFYGSTTGLPLTPSWEKFGYASNRYMGTLVSAAGDINNDGYDDVAIVEKVSTYTHRIYLFNGSATGLNATYSWNKDVPKKPTDIEAGDLNNDGYDDIVIGCPDENEGTIYCYEGSAAGLSLTLNWSRHGSLYLGELGYGVAIGDTNMDGYADLAVSDCVYKGEGIFESIYNDVVLVYYGTETGIDTINFYSVEREGDSYTFGRTMDFCDHNGDGFPDLIVGNYESADYTTYGGGVYVVEANEMGLFGGHSNLFYAEQAYANFGKATSYGDINGDGYSDLVICGEQLTVDDNTGVTIVVYGSEDLLHDFRTTPQSDSTWNYVPISETGICAGDVNGDGFDDILVGDNDYTNDIDDQGTAIIYPGSAGGISADPIWQIEGDAVDAYLGWRLCHGDFDNDGYDDVIIQSLVSDLLRGYSGGPDGPSATADWYFDAEGISEMICPGDINGDGYEDFIIGWEYYDGNVGRVTLFLGSSLGLPIEPTQMYIGLDNGYNVGSNVTPSGDINADGFNDFISGSWRFENGDAYEGAIFIFYGSISGDISNPVIIESNQYDLRFGSDVGGAGDVNNDGYDDVLVLSSLYNDDIRLYFGDSYGLDTSNYIYFNYNFEDLQGIGDANADGYDDFAFCDWSFHPYANLYEAGGVLVYYGNIDIDDSEYCDIPEGIAVAGIFPGSAGINWDNSPDINEFVIRWKKILETEWNYDTAIVSNYLITGLDMCATYQYQLKTNCDPTNSGWSPLAEFASYCTEECEPVTGLALDSVVTSNIYVSWDPAVIGEGYLVDYKKTELAVWSTIFVTTTFATITSVPWCKDYNIRIRTVCSEDTSDYSATITVESACGPCYAVPDDLFATNITPASAKLHWDADPGAINYKLYYRKVGVAAWTKKNSATNVKKITGLIPATTYEYKVKTECADDWFTTFSAIATFTTLPLRIEPATSGELSFTIYPNPSSENITLYIESTSEEDILISIFSTAGNKMFSKTTEFENVISMTTRFPSGAYIVTIAQADKQTNQMLIIQ